MASQQTIDRPKSKPGRKPDSAAEEPAEDLATLTANRPLKILNEEVGSDPYNHTGRFSAPTGDD